MAAGTSEVLIADVAPVNAKDAAAGVRVVPPTFVMVEVAPVNARDADAGATLNLSGDVAVLKLRVAAEGATDNFSLELDPENVSEVGDGATFKDNLEVLVVKLRVAAAGDLLIEFRIVDVCPVNANVAAAG